MKHTVEENSTANIRESAQQLVDGTRNYAKDQVKAQLEKVEAIQSDVIDHIKENPVKSIAAAVLFGVVFGKLIFKR